jgi:hypothetical protein
VSSTTVLTACSYNCQALDIYECNILGSCLLFENCAHWCVDLTAPNGAVCVDAPPTSVEAPREDVKARDDVDSTDSVDDKNGKTYECTANHAGVLTCEFGFCSVEPGDWCAKGWSCRDSCACCKNGKKRGTEMTCNKKGEKRGIETARTVPDLPARGVVDVKPRADVEPIDNTGSVDNKNGKTYMCTNAHRGVLTCEWGFCYVEQGHWCKSGSSCRDECACCRQDKKRDIETTRTVPDTAARDMDVKPRTDDASIASTNGKTYMCTDTHRGVLTCEFGFCYVKPGDWCKSGWSCRDECACCRKDKKRELDGSRAVERALELEVRTSSAIERDVPAQVLDTYGSCPHDCWGHQSCHEENSVIVVCDPADSSWRVVGKCVGGNGCCESRRDNPYAAQCRC